MYGRVLGASTVAGTGAIVLPNTGGSAPLTIVALTAIAGGVAVLISTVARAVVKKAYKA
jgi:hypothetical protein